jgi:hypothetical protein
MTDGKQPTEEEQRRLAEERWNKEFGPEASPRKKFLMIALFVVAFFGILAAVFNSATY